MSIKPTNTLKYNVYTMYSVLIMNMLYLYTEGYKLRFFSRFRFLTFEELKKEGDRTPFPLVHVYILQSCP